MPVRHLTLSLCAIVKNGKIIVCTHKPRNLSQSWRFFEFLVRSEQQVFKLPSGFNHQSACLVEPALAHYCFRKIDRKLRMFFFSGVGLSVFY